MVWQEQRKGVLYVEVVDSVSVRGEKNGAAVVSPLEEIFLHSK